MGEGGKWELLGLGQASNLSLPPPHNNWKIIFLRFITKRGVYSNISGTFMNWIELKHSSQKSCWTVGSHFRQGILR